MEEGGGGPRSAAVCGGRSFAIFDLSRSAETLFRRPALLSATRFGFPERDVSMFFIYGRAEVKCGAFVSNAGKIQEVQ